MTQEKLKPRDLACFESVALVLGEEIAAAELMRVIRCDTDIEDESEDLSGAFSWSRTPQGGKFWSLVDDGIFPVVDDDPEYTGGTAPDFLSAALSHMQDRAATYDAPQGERSMGKTVTAFNALTGHDLTEEQGWLFMQVLKAARTQQGGYRADNYEDGAAYVALMGEAAARESGNE